MHRMVIVVALLLVGCAPPQMPAKTFLDATLGPKASFDMNCARANLLYTNLDSSPARGRYAFNGRPLVTVDDALFELDGFVSHQQGVRGCANRSSYTYVDDSWLGAASVAPASDTK